VENGKLTEIQPPWPTVEVTLPTGGGAAGVQVKLGDVDTIAVRADGTFDGDSEVAETELMFVVEKPDGRLELLKPSEFRARVSGASGSADGRATSARSGDAPPLVTAPLRGRRASGITKGHLARPPSGGVSSGDWCDGYPYIGRRPAANRHSDQRPAPGEFQFTVSQDRCAISSETEPQG
jgi:hypothetical protein